MKGGENMKKVVIAVFLIVVAIISTAAESKSADLDLYACGSWSYYQPFSRVLNALGPDNVVSSTVDSYLHRFATTFRYNNMYITVFTYAPTQPNSGYGVKILGAGSTGESDYKPNAEISGTMYSLEPPR